jgi:hypothetical protein
MAQVLGVFPPDAKFDRKRREANTKLIQLLTQYLTKYPHERFGQALRNIGIVTDCPYDSRDWHNHFNEVKCMNHRLRTKPKDSQ